MPKRSVLIFQRLLQQSWSNNINDDLHTQLLKTAVRHRGTECLGSLCQIEKKNIY